MHSSHMQRTLSIQGNCSQWNLSNQNIKNHLIWFQDKKGGSTACSRWVRRWPRKINLQTYTYLLCVSGLVIVCVHSRVDGPPPANAHMALHAVCTINPTVITITMLYLQQSSFSCVRIQAPCSWNEGESKKEKYLVMCHWLQCIV